MNIHILQENLVRALTTVNRVVPTRPQLPILQNIRLDASKEGLTITGTNMETTETVWVGGKIEQDGALCVSARTLFEFISSLPSETVRLVAKKEQLIVSSTGYTAELPTVAASEFPIGPQTTPNDAGNTDKALFVGALSHVLFAAATDEGRPILTGVRIAQADGQTVFVATDGYRMSMKRVAEPIKKVDSAVIPARALLEVVKLCQEAKEEKAVRVGRISQNQVSFTVGDTTLTTRLIEGEYPNVERIIPKNFTTRARIEKAPFLRAVRSAAIFARDNANIIRLSLGAQKITVTANAAQVGKNSVELPANIEGDGGEIAFNSRFLIDFLTNYPEEELFFEMTGSLNSGVFKPVKDENLLHIIMPVRVAG